MQVKDEFLQEQLSRAVSMGISITLIISSSLFTGVSSYIYGQEVVLKVKCNFRFIYMTIY